jgi:hypothetical protein
LLEFGATSVMAKVTIATEVDVSRSADGSQPQTNRRGCRGVVEHAHYEILCCTGTVKHPAGDLRGGVSRRSTAPVCLRAGRGPAIRSPGRQYLYTSYFVLKAMM